MEQGQGVTGSSNWTDDDIYNIIKTSCSITCKNSYILPDTIQNSKKEIYEWLTEYKKQKEDGNK